LPARALAAARAVRRIGRFDLWHSWHYADDYTEAVVARLAGARAWVCTKKNMSWGGRAWRLRCLLATGIVAQNAEMLRRFFPSGTLARKTTLIPRGVDAARFRPDPGLRADGRAAWGLGPDDVVVGTAATLIPLKGHETIVDAVSRLDEPTQVRIAGGPLESDYSRQLRTSVATRGVSERVCFLGHVDDMPKFLNSLDVFVLATRASGEGCPVALLEAMATGVAVVATDVPGSREILADDSSGTRVPADDPERLAEALRPLLVDPALRRCRGAAARQTVLDRFTIEREVADHVRLYHRLLGPARGNESS
jgi:glycosyltransferase involved in cell wall biosynthesis